MRRKNRKWVALVVALYVLVMWSAWHWAVKQRPADGSIFEHIEREAVHNLHQQQAREAAEKAKEQTPPNTGELRLNAAGPAFVAARYDQTHVVFVVATDTESRFSNSPLRRFSGTPNKIPAAATSLAPLAGLHELWEPDPQSLHFFPAVVQKTQPGEQWFLSAGPDSTVPVTIDRPVIAPLGCSLALGFLASLPTDQSVTATAPQYFVVRRAAVESADQSVNSHIAELAWKPSSAETKQIEQQLTPRMKQELAAIDSRLRANAASPGATAHDVFLGPYPNFKEWIHADKGLARGEGVLDYDIRAFHLTPDGKPRLFVRARWKLADTPVFLMTAWFKAAENKPAEEATQDPVLLFADSSWSLSMRQGEAAATLGDNLDFATILNEFDADHDGWAELLIHSYEGNSTAISLYLYTDLGLVSLKTPLHRDLRSPESCLDP